MIRNMEDAQQQALSFLRNQLTVIEPTVYAVQYPDVQYRQLVPVVTGVGSEWVKSITYTSLDQVGRATWFHASARDVPMADITREQFEMGISMAAIGYRYDVQELAVASQLGLSLDTAKADAARRVSEEFIDDVALRGDATKNFTGLINRTDITQIDSPADGGTEGSAYWADKTDAQVTRDFNAALTNMNQSTLGIEMADTVLLPENVMLDLASRPFGTTTMTLLAWLRANNTYTILTGNPLTIAAVRGLETAADNGGGRAIYYRRDPQVLQMHIPMPFRFLDVWRTGPMTFDVPGIMRLGGLEIRRPSAMRYVDGVSAGPIT